MVGDLKKNLICFCLFWGWEEELHNESPAQNIRRCKCLYTLYKVNKKQTTDLCNSDIIHVYSTFSSYISCFFEHALCNEMIHDLPALLLECLLLAWHKVLEINIQDMSTDNCVQQPCQLTKIHHYKSKILRSYLSTLYRKFSTEIWLTEEFFFHLLRSVSVRQFLHSCLIKQFFNKISLCWIKRCSYRISQFYCKTVSHVH